MDTDSLMRTGVSANYLQLLVNSSTDAWAEFDRDRRYVSINPAGSALIRLALETIVGKTSSELAQAFDAYPLSHVMSQIEACVKQAFETGEPIQVTHEWLIPQAIQFYETLYTPVWVDGGVIRVFSVGRAVNRYPILIPQPVLYKTPGLQSEVKNDHSPIVGAELPELPELPESPNLLLDGSLLQDNLVKPPRAKLSGSKLPGSKLPGSKLSGSNYDRNAIERQQVEMIGQSAELLQLVLDNIPQYIFWKDRNLVYIGCNRRWAEMVGIGEPENIVGITDNELPWTVEETSWSLQCDRRVMDTNTPLLKIKQSQLQADGRLTWQETNKLPIHDADGNVIGILGTIEDITERKLAEDLLRLSEAKFRQLAKQEELLNQVSNQIRNSLDLQTTLQTIVCEVRQLFDTDRVVVYQFQADWHGSVVVEDVLSPWQSVLGDLGADDCFSAQFADLYREGRVRAIDNILEAGLNDCHVHFLEKIQVKSNVIVPIIIQSQLWGLLVGHQCRSVRVWQNWEIGLLRQLADQVAIAIQQAKLYAQAHQSTAQAQSQAQHLERALQELQQTQAQLIQTEKMSSLGQLVAGVAHEINNPVNFIYGNLAHIRGYSEDLVRLVKLYQRRYPEAQPEIAAEIEAIDLDFLIEDLSKILASMKVGSDRIRQIVLSLRNFSRLDEAEMKPVNIHEGIDSTLLILQHRLKAKAGDIGIQVIKAYGDLPLVECYAVQLNQVFMNLLCNAIDALESYKEHRSLAEIRATPATITICTKALLAEQRVVFRIKDNGPGMSESVQQKLFNPFFTTKPLGKGTGLGLSISHQIAVEKHGGTLECISELGAGTEFVLTIPIYQNPAVRQSRP